MIVEATRRIGHMVWWSKGLKTVLLWHVGHFSKQNMLSSLTSQVMIGIALIFQYILYSILSLGWHYSLGFFFIYVGNIILRFIPLVSSLAPISFSKDIWRISMELPTWLSSMYWLLAVNIPLRVLVTWPSTLTPSWDYGWDSSSTGGLANNSDNSVLWFVSD